VRYFEVSPGGYSSLEKHQHAHVVIAVRGQGRAILDATAHDMQPLDTVYVAPWTPHQFLALGAEPFGFFCIVDAERDRPQSVSPTEHDSAVQAGAVR
jgi:quercetin dioxygenase-like cupin family protein